MSMRDDIPPMRCLGCGMQFWVTWVNRGGEDGVEYCPFCGDDDLSMEKEDD